MLQSHRRGIARIVVDRSGDVILPMRALLGARARAIQVR
jgi:hypothetical protein